MNRRKARRIVLATVVAVVSFDLGALLAHWLVS